MRRVLIETFGEQLAGYTNTNIFLIRIKLSLFWLLFILSASSCQVSFGQGLMINEIIFKTTGDSVFFEVEIFNKSEETQSLEQISIVEEKSRVSSSFKVLQLLPKQFET